VPTCRDMSELVTDYLERAVPVRTRLEMRWHLAVCGACRSYFAQMRQTVGLLARLPRQPPPAGTEERLLTSLPPEAPDKPADPIED